MAHAASHTHPSRVSILLFPEVLSDLLKRAPENPSDQVRAALIERIKTAVEPALNAAREEQKRLPTSHTRHEYGAAALGIAGMAALVTPHPSTLFPQIYGSLMEVFFPGSPDTPCEEPDFFNYVRSCICLAMITGMCYKLYQATTTLYASHQDRCQIMAYNILEAVLEFCEQGKYDLLMNTFKDCFDTQNSSESDQRAVLGDSIVNILTTITASQAHAPDNHHNPAEPAENANDTPRRYNATDPTSGSEDPFDLTSLNGVLPSATSADASPSSSQRPEDHVSHGDTQAPNPAGSENNPRLFVV